jgi:hypothetical protein
MFGFDVVKRKKEGKEWGFQKQSSKWVPAWVEADLGSSHAIAH